MWTARAGLIALIIASGCSTPNGTNGGTDMAGPGGGNPDLSAGGGGDMPAGTGIALKRPSRSSAIAISDDDKYVAAVSPDDDIVYIITTTNSLSTSVTLPAGSEPRSIAYSPDGTFWVANKGTGTIVQITNITTTTPTAGTPIAVGAEPTGIAVTPHGTRVVVANFADGTISIVPTGGGAATAVAVGPNPRALVISNSGGDDTAETAFVTLMFGQPVGGGTPSEGSDIGRQGQVVPVGIGSATAAAPLALAPIADTTFTVANKANPPQAIKVGAYPNQLQSIALASGRLYVPSTAASPAGPIGFKGNVHPFVSVYDTAQKKELAFGTSGADPNGKCGLPIANGTIGYAAGTVDLAIQTQDLNGATLPPPVLFPTVPVDIDFVPGKDVGYVLSMASDEVLRVVWDYTANTFCAGANVAKVINLQAAAGDIKVPIGIVVRNDGTGAFVNSWVGREVEVVDFAQQKVTARLPLSPQPTTDPQKTIQKGKKFFYTSTGRWSNKGWGSCGACHPDGLSDNVTWVFGVGPRQTIPMDAIYAKPKGTLDTTDERLLNWTAINDEIHDFENNTRGVSGGLGAVVSTTNAVDTQIDLTTQTGTGDFQLNGSVQKLAADGTTPRPLVGGGVGTVNTAVASDWDAIDTFVQTLRSTRRPSNLPAASVTRGASLFMMANCANCHSGAKWTLSRRPYTPAQLVQGAVPGSVGCSMQTTALNEKSLPNGGTLPENTDQFQLELERPGGLTCPACGGTPGIGCNAGQNYCSIGPQRATCALRNVATFGAGAQGKAFEVRSDTDNKGNSLIAQGQTGFNIPSLLSLAVSAPYLHNGAAPTLVDLFTNPAFTAHTNAAAPNNFALSAADAQDLANFLLSIDVAQTFVDAGQFANTLDLCANSFASNTKTCTNP
jgi:DNA-binding beta-propeller fold protein YncE